MTVSIQKRLLGLLVIAVAFLVYGPGSLLFASAQEKMVEQEVIGAPGWQPRARSFLFSVPFHRQERALSCEVASLRSALLGLGIDIPEWDLWLGLPKDYTVKQRTNAGIVWGDPQKGFVGNVNGRMPETGYGVFIDPIESLASLYASTSRIHVDRPQEIDAALRQGRPIITWSAIGANPSYTSWITEEGKQIQAPLYEHTVVIVGYRGTADFIEGVYIIDPLTSLEYQTWDEFHHRTSFFDHVGLGVGLKD